jgi:hypothetical protein
MPAIPFNLFKQVAQGMEYRCGCFRLSIFFRDDIDIQIWLNLFVIQPEVFANKPFDPIPCDRISDPLCYGDTKT